MSVLSMVLTVLVLALIGLILISLWLYKNKGFDESYIIVSQFLIIWLMFANAGIQYLVEHNLEFAIMFSLIGLSFIILVIYKLNTYKKEQHNGKV